MADLHFQIRIPIPIPFQTADQMATLQYAELFILHGISFRFPSQLPSTGMGLESESATVNVNNCLSLPKYFPGACTVISRR